MAATVKADTCTGCGVCVEACPVEAIGLTDGVARIDDDRCVSCGVCVDECPNEAISLD